MAQRVVLAMSGGVDSSVAAYLLLEQGYEVIGLFMRTGAHEDHAPPDGPGCSPRRKTCCSALDAGDARRVADRLDIPFYALNFEQDFGRIMDYFVEEYAAGRTPNPCVLCNNWLKFGKLWSYGRQLGADFVATGHYARIERRGGDFHLLRATGEARAKDQSYVLFGLRRQLLPRILLPVGGYPKPEIRRIARDLGLAVHDKPDSQEICFVTTGNYLDFVRRRRPEPGIAGDIVDPDGRSLARHDGIERYTVGQRKGLGIAVGQPRYVVEIDPAAHRVVVGGRADLLRRGLRAERVNWLMDPPAGELRCTAQIRSHHTAAPAVVSCGSDRGVEVVFDEPQSAITPGQVVVFYDGDRVLGGGWITESHAHPPTPVKDLAEW